jgi:hypothetical protein
LQSLADELTRSGGKAIAVATDVGHREQVKGLVEAAVKILWRIDVMINNAELMPQASLERLNVDEWDRMIDLNMKRVLYGIAAALPHMKQKAGHFINVSSVARHKVGPGYTVYAATKHAVRALSEGLAGSEARRKADHRHDEQLRKTTRYKLAAPDRIIDHRKCATRAPRCFSCTRCGPSHLFSTDASKAMKFQDQRRKRSFSTVSVARIISSTHRSRRRAASRSGAGSGFPFGRLSPPRSTGKNSAVKGLPISFSLQ